MPTALKSIITGLVSGIEPTDDLGREHSRNALSWLAGTDDIFRRVKPLTPSPHLVSYFLLVDRPGNLDPSLAFYRAVGYTVTGTVEGTPLSFTRMR